VELLRDSEETMTDSKKTYDENVRADVYKAIDGERDYQGKWECCGVESRGKHETGAFIVFMEHYLQEARRLESTLENGGNNRAFSYPANGERREEGSLDFVRKVTALGVACMEQNGAPEREVIE
jgi:hypothetical protein